MEVSAHQNVLFKNLLVLTKDGEWGPETGSEESVPMHIIRGTDFNDVRLGSLHDVPIRYIHRKNAAAKTLHAGDIILETAGGTRDQPTGRSVLLKNRLMNSATHAVTCASFSRFLRFNQDVVNPEFMYWWLQASYKNGTLYEFHVQHTGVARFQYTSFATTTFVELPSLPTQKAIAEALGALDDRIELNQRMNATLEAMAQALFKSWFVDFDPVRAKMDGNQPFGMDAETAALFPSYLVPSELGDIPEGWEVKPLDQIAKFLNGLALQKYPPTSDAFLPVIKISQIRQGHAIGADRAASNIPAEYVLDNGDVIFSWSGSLMQVLWTGGKGALNQHLFKVTSETFPKWFHFMWVEEHMPWFQSIAASKATTMGHIQRQHLEQAKVIIPPQPTLIAMDKIFAPIFAKKLEIGMENSRLEKTRDYLLPKLISGDIRIPDAEKFVGAAA